MPDFIIDWTPDDTLSPREQYDAADIIDQVKALVAARRAQIAHDLAAETSVREAASVLGISGSRVYGLVARHRQAQTDRTTEYLDWADAHDGSARWFTEYLREVLAASGEDPDAYPLGAIGDAYEDAIQAALPEGVTFTREVFVGPAPAPDGVREVIRAAVASVDLWAIIAEHAPDDATS